jgi:hypothetical protein
MLPLNKETSYGENLIRPLLSLRLFTFYFLMIVGSMYSRCVFSNIFFGVGPELNIIQGVNQSDQTTGTLVSKGSFSSQLSLDAKIRKKHRLSFHLDMTQYKFAAPSGKTIVKNSFTELSFGLQLRFTLNPRWKWGILFRRETSLSYLSENQTLIRIQKNPTVSLEQKFSFALSESSNLNMMGKVLSPTKNEFDESSLGLGIGVGYQKFFHWAWNDHALPIKLIPEINYRYQTLPYKEIHFKNHDFQIFIVFEFELKEKNTL